MQSAIVDHPLPNRTGVRVQLHVSAVPQLLVGFPRPLFLFVPVLLEDSLDFEGGGNTFKNDTNGYDVIKHSSRELLLEGETSCKIGKLGRGTSCGNPGIL